MRDQYRDRSGRSEPPGGLYLGNCRVGSVIRWDDSGRVAKIIDQATASTTVKVGRGVKVFTPHHGPKSGEVVSMAVTGLETWKNTERA